MESRTIASRVTVQGKADQLAHAALFFRDAGRVNRILEEYESITLEEIRAVAGRYLRQTNRCTIVYHTSAAAEE